MQNITKIHTHKYNKCIYEENFQVTRDFRNYKAIIYRGAECKGSGKMKISTITGVILHIK